MKMIKETYYKLDTGERIPRKEYEMLKEEGYYYQNTEVVDSYEEEIPDIEPDTVRCVAPDGEVFYWNLETYGRDMHDGMVPLHDWQNIILIKR